MKTYLILIILLASFFISSAHAQGEADFSALILTGEQQVEEIIDPLRLRLLDGRILQLSGIDIPDLTPYDTGEIGLAAMTLLKETFLKKYVKIYQDKNKDKGRMNRMGYHIAHLAEKNSNLWIQALLIQNGLARVRPSAQNIEMAEQMMALELIARKEKRGLWADEKYAVLTPETAGSAMHGWAIIEGTIRASAMAKNTVFLNFGNDWRTDFTVGIPSQVRRTLVNAAIDPLKFSNKHVRVRGWVEDYNGPYIELIDPVWIEILPDVSEKATLAE